MIIIQGNTTIWQDIQCRNCYHAEFEHYQKDEIGMSTGSRDPEKRPCKCCPCEHLDPYVSAMGVIE